MRASRPLALILVMIWSLFPIYWAAKTSLETDAQAQSGSASPLPGQASFANYGKLLSDYPANPTLPGQIRQSLLNMAVECVAATVLTVVVATLAAYAFARMDFPGKKPLFYTVLATMALPAYATLIPLYRLMSTAGLVNTYTGIVLVYASGFAPLATWILHNYFSTIPRELEDAAKVDGATAMQTLGRVLIPVASPGIAAAAIITFLFAWSQFLFPLVLSTDLGTQPLTLIISSLQGQHTVPYTLLNAAGVLAIAVPALVTLLLNRYIVRGLLAGSFR